MELVFACDPYLLSFLDGNAITLMVLAAIIKSWAVLSRRTDGHKVSDLVVACINSLLSFVPGRRGGNRPGEPGKAGANEFFYNHQVDTGSDFVDADGRSDVPKSG